MPTPRASDDVLTVSPGARALDRCMDHAHALLRYAEAYAADPERLDEAMHRRDYYANRARAERAQVEATLVDGTLVISRRAGHTAPPCEACGDAVEVRG